MIRTISSLYADITSSKKLETYHASIPHKTLKTHFGPILGLL